MTCHFRTYSECSCGPSECRVSRPLPHITHRQARYNLAYTKANRALHVAAVCFAFCVVLAGVLLAAESGIARQDTIMQEVSSWER